MHVLTSSRYQVMLFKMQKKKKKNVLQLHTGEIQVRSLLRRWSSKKIHVRKIVTCQDISIRAALVIPTEFQIWIRKKNPEPVSLYIQDHQTFLQYIFKKMLCQKNCNMSRYFDKSRTINFSRISDLDTRKKSGASIPIYLGPSNLFSIYI